MTALAPDSDWIHTLKKLPGMPDFMVFPSLRPLGCTAQSLLDVAFTHFFKILMPRQNVLPKTFPVIGLERSSICNDPRFHCLNHQVNPVAVDVVEVPPVKRGQMLGRGRLVYLTFGVHQEHHNPCINALALILKTLIGLVARTATNQLPSPVSFLAGGFDFGQKRLHTQTQGGSGALVVSAAFHVDRDVHGFAPNSPIRHRSPSV